VRQIKNPELDEVVQFRPAADAEDPLTEDALALRFSERHQHDLRYVEVKGQWYKWDGSRWLPEQTLLAFDLVRDSCRSDAEDFGNGKPPAKLYSAKTIAAVERLAKADRRQSATLEQFDANDWLFNANETIDLRTGIGCSPRPEDYITKKAGCDVAPVGTRHPLWSDFLDRITGGNIALQQFLQRYAGYCLTGDTSQHVFVFAYGTGANGKSTYINTIARIFGDYATIADVGTFIASNTERHPTDVAKLHGHRLAIAQETQSGRRWDEAKIKSMTGGDKMTARFMRQDYFDFKPKFKLFITGNHKPHLENVDEAIRRRMLLVPFTVQIPPDERDPQLADKLMAQGPAILRWCIDGCLDWQQHGLMPPAVVTEATDAYFDDQDTIGQWLDDCTEDGGSLAVTPAKKLFASWKNWTDERGLVTGSMKALSEALTDKGYEQKRTERARGFKRLTLKSGYSYNDE
jgi:P4 family phage/plasmid primase-like protien